MSGDPLDDSPLLLFPCHPLGETGHRGDHHPVPSSAGESVKIKLSDVFDENNCTVPGYCTCKVK